MMGPLLRGRFGAETDCNVTGGPTWPRAAIVQVCARACGRQLIRLAVGAVLWVGPAVACCYPWDEPLAAPMNCPVPPTGEASSTPAAVLAPQQTFRTYQARALRQPTTPAPHSDQTTIDAEKPTI